MSHPPTLEKTSQESMSFDDVRKNYLMSPGREFDTSVAIEPTFDTMLTAAAATSIASRAGEAREVWESLKTTGEWSQEERIIIDRNLAEIALVSCAAEQVLYDEDVSQEIAELESILYDHYDPNTFHQAVSAKIKQVEEFTIPAKFEERRTVLLRELKKYGATENKESAIPSERTFEAVSEWLQDQFGDIFDEIDAEGLEEYEAPRIVEYMQKAIDSTEVMRKLGWQAELVERQKNAVSVQSSRKRIVVPTQRKVSAENLKKLIVHEVFGHALRSALAEEAGMTIGRQGTAAYSRFEESFMIALEQCYEKEHDPLRGTEHYIAVGMIETEKLPPEQVAHLLREASFLKFVNEHGEEKASSKADSAITNMMRRTFAGMTDVEPGIVHRKDIDYYHGIGNAWRFLNYAVENNCLDEAMRWVLTAKFDPFNSDDRAYIEHYCPVPVKLAGLFGGDNNSKDNVV